MSTSSIAEQVDEFNVGFEAQIGPRLSAVFSGEQNDLRAAGVPADVVSVGDEVPDAAVLTPEGASTTFHEVLAGKTSVVVFYRGAWCPYCNITLRTYQEKLVPALQERGAQLVAVSPQTPEGSAQAVENGSLDFAVVSDPANALASSLGIVTEPSAEARSAHTELGFDVADSNADDTAAIPFPTVLVVDEQGVVRFVDIKVDYTTRTEPEEILGAVDALAV
ncbi:MULTISPECIES: peroxiredoxin-like family protein [Microbacterium]|uniref:peroxiredoxin-like family protein n=1 Tax=Microbacterium TaxID=33882 RepID=UPI0034670A34